MGGGSDVVSGVSSVGGSGINVLLVGSPKMSGISCLCVFASLFVCFLSCLFSIM